MPLLDPLLTLVNSFGSTLTSTLTTLLWVNNAVGALLVSIFCFVASVVSSIVSAISSAIRILLEDLFIFVLETYEAFIYYCETLFKAVDQFFGLVFGLAGTIKSTFVSAVTSIGGLVAQIGNTFNNGLSSASEFFSLLGSSVVLLVQLVPRTLYLGAKATCSCLYSAFVYTKEGVYSAANSFVEAPWEILIGFLSGVAISYSVYILGKKIIRHYDLTPSQIIRSTFSAFCTYYLLAIRGLLSLLLMTLGCIITLLAHIHMPRFHHAGDSEDDEEEEQEALIGQVDSSDNEENERLVNKRKHYNMLLKRRLDQQRLNQGQEDMEGILFEQVEREREDKLCVICQDNEKCIMILPCRHLCICQDCQLPLRRRGNNSCPICRRNVKQTIKAYL